MPVERVATDRSAVSEPYLMIMQFDPHNAEMTKFGDTYANSDYNRAEAERDAAAAADQAAAKGLELQYIVVRAEAVAAFTSYTLPG